MSIDAIEEFGAKVASRVRDVAMSQCCNIPNLDGHAAGMERRRAAAAAAGGQLPVKLIIQECIDITLYEVLYAMDDSDLLHILYATNAGEVVDWSVIGWGEPVGWYIGAPGWRTWYSNEDVDDRYDHAHVSAEYGVEDDSNDPAPNLDDLDMRRRAIEELGILFVHHVRDVAIQSCDLQLLPHSQTAVAKRWRRAAIPFNGQVPPQVLIPDCVDEAIYAFLHAIDQGLLPLSYVSENGETVDLVKEGRGELATRYIAPDGWRAKYSKERIHEDVAD